MIQYFIFFYNRNWIFFVRDWKQRICKEQGIKRCYSVRWLLRMLELFFVCLEIYKNTRDCLMLVHTIGTICLISYLFLKIKSRFLIRWKVEQFLGTKKSSAPLPTDRYRPLGNARTTGRPVNETTRWRGWTRNFPKFEKFKLERNRWTSKHNFKKYIWITCRWCSNISKYVFLIYY